MKRRRISTEEYQFALSIFEREFPPRDIITITDGLGIGGRRYVRPTADGHIRIYMGSLYNKCLESDSNKAEFAHELTHAWQIEHYGLPWYGAQAFDNQILSSNAYAYLCDPKKNLGDYNAEQQSEIVKDYFLKHSCASAVAKKTLSSKTWKLLIGSDGRDIAVDANGLYYLVNSAGLIYKYEGNDWQRLSGSAGRSIAANHNRICLVNTKGMIFELFNNSWKRMPGSDAMDIAINQDGTVWMVNTEGKIYQYQESAWKQMPGSDGARISAGGGQVWLINSVGSIYKFNGSAWTQIIGSDGKDIAVANDGSVFLTNTSGNIYQWTGNNWKQLDGSDGHTISANNGKLALVNTKGRLYFRNFGVPDNRNWSITIPPLLAKS